jgi:DNA polymerase I
MLEHTNVSLSPLLSGEVWAVDFEFFAPTGGRPTPVCMVALELRTGKIIRLWADELKALHQAPFDTGPQTVFVAYYASAEIGCFLALGWEIPKRILDLFTEFRAETNGTELISGRGLIGALAHYGLDAISATEKDEMRDLILGGGPWSPKQKAKILDYCESDVRSLESLLPAMAPAITISSQRLGWALLRGRYMAAIARMEWTGVPIDVKMFQALQDSWDHIPVPLIEAVDADFGVFHDLTFKTELFEDYLVCNDIPWPRLESGKLALSDDVFRQQAKAHPGLAPLRELRHALSELRLNKLAVGEDGRNRTLLSPFRSKTGRNQPSNSKFIFGPSVWLRGLIKPARGRAIAYLDWKSQEIAIAAALSDDDAMWAAYSTGDPYLAFAKQAGLAPPEATKETHKDIRDRCKAIVLGVQYGMSAESMALNAGIHVVDARDLLLRHKGTFWQFWKWAEQNVNMALLGGTLRTRFGWPFRLGYSSSTNARSLLNWPMQSNGAEMMRLACCEATEAGLNICAPIHDALLLEAPANEIDDQSIQLSNIMQEASELVLGDGRICGVDVDKVVFPDRYADGRGIAMWNKVMDILADEDPVVIQRGTPSKSDGPVLSY